jgi:hypothetical protein
MIGLNVNTNMEYMDLDTNRFLNLLFDEGQTSCYTESPHGYKVTHSPRREDLFFCINALHPHKDLLPTKEWHDEHSPRRADANVVCLRNFLIEMDDLELDEQIEYVMDQIPVSTVVYSGGKSYHFIISLEEPLSSLQEYKNIAKRLHKLLTKADSTTKNPSRLSRLPNRIRPETGDRQRLYYLGKRINKEDLLAKLPEIETVSYEHTDTQQKSYITPLIIEACMIPTEVMENRGIGGRNAFFYWLGKRMDDVNMEPEKRLKYIGMAYENLEDSTGFAFEEACSAARIRQ